MTTTLNLPLRARFGLRRSVSALIAFGAGALLCHESRSRLRDLSDHELRDIGVTRRQAKLEAARPIWDVPSHWLR